MRVFSVNLFRFEQLLMRMRMATRGEWRPVLEFLSEAMARQMGIRDYIIGETVMAPRAGALGFPAAYLSVTDYYVFRSEAELGRGTRGHRAGTAGGPLSEPAARYTTPAPAGIARAQPDSGGRAGAHAGRGGGPQ